ncbi:type IV pilus assembly protein PilC [Anaerobranca californiensis DSM 14826]|uniref:Type IV pilus assembly protein PilC n=1 Tax=Anaerobranca californiensis DSM 14826 TaxID=1120989 RepID=A0A1M6LBG8_9FIRM|nr:type II secretion system F family protein [Anaerobranca californiensis]SHJ68509.1 type IV pilus assembly protein PilC [Anaerobranca californiensis DSM 14826]
MQFQYIAKNLAGETIKGQIEAEDQKRALHLLREQKLYVLNLKRARIQTGIKLFIKKVSVKDLSMFCSQLATMLKAGISITKSLNALGEQTENKVLKKTIKEIVKDLENGSTLKDSVEKHDDVFPQIFISLIEAGETGGVLDIVLERLALYFDGERELKENIKTAMTYPLFIGGFAIIVAIFMLTFMVPNFVSMFEEVGAMEHLPFITKLLIAVSDFLKQNLIILIIGIFVLITSLRFFFQKQNIRIWWDYKKTQLPIFGRLMKKVAVARFCRTMALMSASNVGIVNALQLVAKAVDNANFGEEILDVLVGLQEGGTLSSEFSTSKFLDNLTLQMLTVGEETGDLDQMLEKIGVYLEQDVKYSTKRMASLIEPILIIGVALLVAVILIGVMLPVFDILQFM